MYSFQNFELLFYYEQQVMILYSLKASNFNGEQRKGSFVVKSKRNKLARLHHAQSADVSTNCLAFFLAIRKFEPKEKKK